MNASKLLSLTVALSSLVADPTLSATPHQHLKPPGAPPPPPPGPSLVGLAGDAATCLPGFSRSRLKLMNASKLLTVALSTLVALPILPSLAAPHQHFKPPGAGGGPPPPPPPRPAPAPAAAAGFNALLFESDFSKTVKLTDEFSCGPPPADQTAKWKQGLWFEANEATGLAPCSQITLTNDAPLGGQALDLAWIAAGNKDSQDATSITTYPIDTTSPHFTFQHGYVEVVMRATNSTNAAVWATAWALSDPAITSDNVPVPLGSTNFSFLAPLVELDLAELHGPNQLDAAISESNTGGNAQFIGPNNDVTSNFDFSQPHTYGFLWTSAGQGKGGQVCSYLDNAQRGCAPSGAATESQPIFLVLNIGAGCNFTPGDRTCLNGLARADLLVQRVSVWGTVGDEPE